MNRFIAYSISFIGIIVGVFAFMSIKVNDNLDEYMQSSEKELDEYLSLNSHFKSADKSTSVLVLEKQDKWDSYVDFKLLKEATLFWEEQEGVLSASSIVNLYFPKKRLINVQRDLFVPLTNPGRFEKWYKRKDLFPDVTPKFLSKDLSYTLIYLQLDKERLSNPVWVKFGDWASKKQGLKVHHINKEVVQDHLKASGISNVTLISILATLLIVCTFYFLTRSLSGLVIILIGISFNLSITALSMWIFDVHFSLYMISVPCIIIVLSFTDLMHLLYYHAQLPTDLNAAKKRTEVLSRIGFPMLITSLSNMIGFIAFIIFAQNALLFELAIISLIGVTVAFLSTRFLIPYLLLPRRKYIRLKPGAVDRNHFSILRFVSTNRGVFKTVVFASFGLLALFSFRMFDIDWDDNDFIESESEVYQTRKILSSEFYGEKNAEIIISYKDELWSRKTLEIIQEVDQMIDSVFDVSYINSPVLLAKRFNRFQYNGHSGAFRIPSNWTPRKVDQMYRSTDMLGGSELISSESRYAKIKFGFHTLEISKTLKQYETLSDYLRQISTGDLTFVLTGKNVLSDQTVWSFTINVFSGIFIALLFSMLIILFVKRSFQLFVGVLIVNAIPLLVVLVIMFSLGFFINPLTLFLLSVLIGICIDDTVYLVMSSDKRSKVHYYPILVTSVVLAIAFTSLAAAGYDYLKVFSFLFLVGIFTAYLLDVFILPIFLNQTDKIDHID